MPPTIQKTMPRASAPVKGGGVLSRIRPLEFDASEGIKIMLYGQSGSGKTTLAATFPAPILWAVASAGSSTTGKMPGELRSVATKENRKRIFPVTLERADELNEIVDGAGDYKTIVLDHVTGYQDLVLSAILGKPVPEQKGWGLASQQQYGQMTLQVKEYLRKLLNLSINVVIVGQERTFGDESNSELIQPTVGVGTTPALAGWLNTACDYICNTFKRGAETIETTKVGLSSVAMKKPKLRADGTPAVEYCLRTAPSPVYMTKFRVPRSADDLPSVIVDPTYDKIMEAIRGESG